MSGVLVTLYRRAVTKQIAVPVDIVDTTHKRPVLTLAQRCHRIGGCLSGIGVRPVVCNNIFHQVWGIAQRVVLLIEGAFFNDGDFLADSDDAAVDSLPDLGVDARMIHSTFVAAFAPTGLPCSAGHDYFHILPDANVFPCRTYRSLGRSAHLGSALD